MQTTSHILMIRPVNFFFNEETAGNNAFQARSADTGVQEKAQEEFDRFTALLRANGINVLIVNDTPSPSTPDSIFPNNWVSFHEDASIVLYPMYAPNRRGERKEHVLDTIEKNFRLGRRVDLSFFEQQNQFLEGTGSMVLDRDHKLAYASISPRTNVTVLDQFCLRMGYKSIVFCSVDRQGRAIYHTNVMMCVADRFVVICLDSIPDSSEKELVIDSIGKTEKELVDITYDQLEHFAGNMLQVRSRDGEKLLVMSTQAYRSLTGAQIATLSSYNRILHSSLSTIEANGGGSARCMMAEIHLPLLNNE